MTASSMPKKPTAPPDIPQDIYDTASRIAEDFPARVGPFNRSFAADVIARALAAERERAAGIADAYATENLTMAGDTILMDPVLNRRPSSGPLTVDELDRSEDLLIGGTIHSSMYHAANNIAAAIRKGEGAV